MTSEYLKVIEAELHARYRDELFKSMSKALREAAFNLDTIGPILPDSMGRKIVKELADAYRSLADKADAWVMKDRATEDEAWSERT